MASVSSHAGLSRADLRDGIFRLFVGLGLLCALVYASQHVPKPVTCKTPHVVRHVASGARCVAKGLGEVAGQWAIILLVGALVGAIAGVLLAQLIPRESRRTAKSGARRR